MTSDLPLFCAGARAYYLHSILHDVRLPVPNWLYQIPNLFVVARRQMSRHFKEYCPLHDQRL